MLENFKLPLFLHIRGNSECVLKAIYILQKYRHLWIEKGAVAHSFTGTKQDLDSLLNIGLDIGINGCSLKTQQNLELLKYIPLDRLHIETGKFHIILKKKVNSQTKKLNILLQIHHGAK